MTEYNLTRSKRKTVAIHITKDARVEVRAPLKVPQGQIDRFVMSKSGWINAHLAQRKKLLEKQSEFRLNYGGFALMRGVEYPIMQSALKRPVFDGGRFCLPPGLSPEQVKRELVKIYRAEAAKLIKDRVSLFSSLMGVTPAAVKTTGAKARWGSCSGKNSVNFSWRLLMAEDDAIDYVVVHELAHIREHNHSKRFWAVVASVLPDYARREKKLRELQTRLAGEDWS